MNTTQNKPKNAELANLLAETDELIKETESYLQANGVTYHLSEWVTLKEYAKRHNLETTNVVSNWISRGTVTPDDIRDFPELNNLRLIRDKEYK